MNPHSLPPRFRESAFRDYEPFIHRIFLRYPGRIDFSIASLNRSPETFSCRLRDAMTSFVTHAWPSNVIDHSKFSEMHPFIIVKQTVDGTVAVGTKDSLREKVAAAVVEVAEANADVVPLPFPIEDLASLQLVCSLAAARLFSKRLRITVADPLWVPKMFDLFDVDCEQQSDGTWILV